MHEIIIFLQTFDKYKHFTYIELCFHIRQSFINNQYKVFKDEDGKIFGFVNWAWVDKKTKEQYFKTGKVKKWNCGDILLPVNFIAKKKQIEIMRWCKKETSKTIGINKNLDWLRLDNNNLIKRIFKTETKGSWLWEM